MVRLIRAERKAMGTQITNFDNHGVQKGISECTTHETLSLDELQQ